MVIDIYVLLNGISDLSKYLIELATYGVILIMMKKCVCHHIRVSYSFAFLWSLYNIIFYSSLITAH